MVQTVSNHSFLASIHLVLTVLAGMTQYEINNEL